MTRNRQVAFVSSLAILAAIVVAIPANAGATSQINYVSNEVRNSEAIDLAIALTPLVNTDSRFGGMRIVSTGLEVDYVGADANT